MALKSFFFLPPLWRLGVWPAWTVCKALCWRGLTAWSFLRELRPACFLKSPCRGLTCAHNRQTNVKKKVHDYFLLKKTTFVWTLTQHRSPQGPGRSRSPWGFWWSSGSWRWAGRWGAPTGSSSAASSSTTWRTHTYIDGMLTTIQRRRWQWLHIPGLLHHQVFLSQEALLNHPLVTQEFWPLIEDFTL